MGYNSSVYGAYLLFEDSAQSYMKRFVYLLNY